MVDKTVIIIIAILVAIVTLSLFDKIPSDTTAVILSAFAGYVTRELTGINREIHRNGGSVTIPSGNVSVTVQKEEK